MGFVAVRNGEAWLHERHTQRVLLNSRGHYGARVYAFQDGHRLCEIDRVYAAQLLAGIADF